MPTITRGRALAYLAVLVVVLVVAGRFLIGSDRAETTRPAAQTFAALELETSPTPSETVDDLVVVHVAGAVRHPGLYRLPRGSRVDDAIREAGGARPRAALELVNLAALIGDGQQVVVPVRNIATGPPTTGGSPEASPAGPVNLNAATLAELDALPGIGPVTAQKILDYREQHGSFSSLDELDAIPGIGPARLEQLRELVTL
jgi:competence protein ComEA